MKRNGKYRCGNHKKGQNECKADMNWTVTPLIDTNGNGLVLTSDGNNVMVTNDIGATNQRWLLSKELSISSESKVVIYREMYNSASNYLILNWNNHSINWMRFLFL